MSLNRNNTSRSYLFGRILAVADAWEQYALNEKRIDRLTTAKRLFETYSQFPARTWKEISNSLVHVEKQLGYAKSHKFKKELEEITIQLSENDFLTNQKLSEEFLLAYYNQIHELKTKKQ